MNPEPSQLSVPEQSPDDEPEVLSKASDVIRPFLKDGAQAQQVAQRIVMAMRVHIGPLPSPETFQAYEVILPGAAEEIMGMATKEQKHRHINEKAESFYPFFGLLAGFIALVLCILGSIYLAIQNQVVIAGLLLGAPLLGAVGWFVNGRLEKNKFTPAATPPVKRPRRR